MAFSARALASGSTAAAPLNHKRAAVVGHRASVMARVASTVEKVGACFAGASMRVRRLGEGIASPSARMFAHDHATLCSTGNACDSIRRTRDCRARRTHGPPGFGARPPFAAAAAAAAVFSISHAFALPKTHKKTKQQSSSSSTPSGRDASWNETYVDEAPLTLLRTDVDTPDTMRARFEAVIRAAQDSICAAISEVDGTPFHQDAWTREAGGGGITRVLADGNVWEKAGVNVSVVYGSMPPDAYRAATGNPDALKGEAPTGRVPFFAAGISSVMHPRNPHAPTMHFNYRYFETDEWNGIPGQWWFGGGTDITPSFVDEADMKHFHGTYKAVCDRHDPAFYPKFKAWCDDYFLIKHRGERRGLGGIFFDDLNDRDADKLLAFSTDAVNSVVDAYVPLVARHKDDAYTDDEKDWQQMRRGRYVEFNLVYDRGTIFGLKTGGRIESILMSLPLTSRWEYDHVPAPGSKQAELLDACCNPRTWV
jgi:coproporphyrinogen III oxidase